VDLFGYHTGCATSIELAKQRPSLVRKIVLNSALMFTQQELADLKESFAKRSAPPLDGQIAGLPDRWKHHRAWWRDVPDEDRAWAMFWESNRDIKHSTWGFTAAFANDFAKTLSETKNPLLIFNPQDDLWEMTPRAKGVAPDMRIHDLPGWTHGYLNAHPDEVAALVRDFLDA
jgi:pimeloyl-ACP methyl ester carboxylesterase